MDDTDVPIIATTNQNAYMTNEEGQLVASQPRAHSLSGPLKPGRQYAGSKMNMNMNIKNVEPCNANR